MQNYKAAILILLGSLCFICSLGLAQIAVRLDPIWQMERRLELLESGDK